MSHGNRKYVVTHIIQQLTLGGAARALVATSKYSSQKGPFTHKVISLVPPTDDGRELATSNGVEVLVGLSRTEIKSVLERSDIVHINWWNNPQVQKLLRSDLPKMRTLVWYHVAGDHAPQLITPSIAGFADINIATNPYTYRSNEALSPFMDRSDHSKLRMIVDPADLERVAGVELTDHSGFNVGYIGTVDFFKMHREFIPMSSSIEVPEIKFLVCGGGIQEQLLQEARELGEEEKFKFLGYVKDIKPIISKLDVYGYPLCEGTYASGELNLQEVMACGVPPVVFPYGGVKDIIHNEKDGLIVESPKEYKEAIEYLYHNPNKRLEMGKQASIKAWSEYGAENAAGKLNSIYEELLEIPKTNHFWGQSDIIVGRSSHTEEVQNLIPHKGAETFCDSMWYQSRSFRSSASEMNADKFANVDLTICQMPHIIHDVGILPYLSEFNDDPYLNYWSGLFWLVKGKYNQAQQAFLRSIQVGLQDFRPHACMSLVGYFSNNHALESEALNNCKTLSGNYEKFVIPFKEVLGKHLGTRDKSADELVKEACDFMANNQWENATECLLQVLNSNGDSLELIQSLATCAIEAGDIANAEIWLKKASELPGRSNLLIFQLSQIQKVQGKKEDALESAKHYFKIEAELSIEFLKYYGELLFENEEYGDSCRVFHKLVCQDNQDWESYFYMAKCMVRRHEFSAAKELSQVAHSLNSNHQPIKDLIQIIDQAGRDVDKPNSQKTILSHGEVATQGHDSSQQEQEFLQWFDSQDQLLEDDKQTALTEAKNRFPRSAEIIERLGIFYLQSGSFENALKEFEKLVLIFPKRESGWTYLAQCALSLGNEPLLEKSLESALNINPKSIDGNHLLAILHFQNENYLEAAKIYHSLISLRPVNEEYYVGLKDCFTKLGETDTAHQVEQRLTDLQNSKIGASDEDCSLGSIEKIEIQPDNSSEPCDQNRPKVSVIVSTYNNADFIEGCLDDLVEQTIFDKIEILVIDSGSEQNEGELVAPYCEKYSNITYLRTEREPLYDAWNRGVKLAKGEYITNANTDDAHRSDALEILSSALDKDLDAELAYGDLYWTDKANDTFENPSILREVKYPDYCPADAMIYCPMGCHPMWRKSVFEKIGLFNSEFRIIGDYEYFLRFVEAGLKAIHVPETISLFYQNDLGLSKNKNGHDAEVGTLLNRFRSRIEIEKIVRISDPIPNKIAEAWAGLGTKICLGVKIPWKETPNKDWDYAIFCLSKALSINSELWAARINLCLAASQSRKDDLLNKHFDKIPGSRKEAVRAGIKAKSLLWEGFACPSPMAHGGNVSVVEEETKTNSSPVANDGRIIEEVPKIDMPIRWIGPTFNESGFASELHTFIFSLYEQGIKPSIKNIGLKVSQKFLDGLSDRNREHLFEMRDSYINKHGGLIVQTGDSNLQPLVGAEHLVGRVMFETDRLPERWMLLCNKMDELWVSGLPQKQAYLNSGVPEHKIHILHSPVDETLFNPNECQKLDLGTGRTFNFFAIFEWIYRKGGDVLFESYFREFTASDDVCLILRTYLPGVSAKSAKIKIQAEIEKIARKVGKSAKDLPKIKVLDSVIPSTLLPSFYHSVDCVLSPSRGEGWGRPQFEAMLMGKPVVATGWGGNMEFMTPETNYLIDYEMRPVSGIEPIYWDYKGSNWAEPNHEHLSQIMRRAFQSRDEAIAIGSKARQHILNNFGRKKILSQLVTHLDRIQDKIKNGGQSFPILDNPIVSQSVDTPEIHGRKKVHVVLEGTFLDYGSLSKVNREIGKSLVSSGNIKVSKVQIRQEKGVEHKEFGNLRKDLKPRVPSQFDFHLRHHWPPNWRDSKNGKVIVIQPWEFGRIPQAWVDAANQDNIEEIWCYSRAVRNAYIDSGVLPGKLRIMPLGFDPKIYNSDGETYELKTNKKIKFLFVGGTIHRKGPDILLEAFCDAFSETDDVCLVIKDFGSNGVYQGQTFEDEIKNLKNRPGAPEIEYINCELSEWELSGLYGACDCLVHPYRGEGFGLPVLEAMACGLPVIVTEGGATDDFVSEEFGWKIPSRKKMIGGKVSKIPLEGDGWMLEPDKNALTSILRSIFFTPELLIEKGRSAQEYAHANHSWDHTSTRIKNVFIQLSAKRESKKLTDRSKKEISFEPPRVVFAGNLERAYKAFEEKDYQCAKDEVLLAITKRPFHPEGYSLLAELFLEVGDIVSAKRVYDQLRAMAPRFKKTKSLSKRLKSHNKHIPKIQQDNADLPCPGVRLSVCLITKNEEEYLPKCLESVKDIADQIVVVDTGSTDRTIDIAKEYNAIIEKFDWNENFSDPRNKSLELATGDWILVLDADEEVDEETKPVLLRSLKDTENMAYRLPIIDIGKEDNGANYVPRLFRNAPGLFFVGRIHEQVFSSIEVRRKEWGLKSAFGEARLLHHGYTEKMNSDRDKVQRNLMLLERAQEEMPNEPNILMNIGMELYRGGNPSVGMKYYFDALHASEVIPAEQISPELRETLLTQVSSVLLAMGKIQAIVDLMNSRLAKIGELTSSLYFTLGLAQINLEQHKAAIQSLSQCIRRKNNKTHSVINAQVKQGGPEHCLGICYEKVGKFDQALEQFGKALHLSPGSLGIQQDFILVANKNNLHLKAIDILNQNMCEGDDSLIFWRLGSQLCSANAQLHSFGVEWIGEALRYHPNDGELNQARWLFLLESCQLDQIAQGSGPSDNHLTSEIFAGIVWVRLVHGQSLPKAPASLEPKISAKMIDWYKKWVHKGDESLIRAINDNINSIKAEYPSAFSVVESVLKQIA